MKFLFDFNDSIWKPVEKTSTQSGISKIFIVVVFFSIYFLLFLVNHQQRVTESEGKSQQKQEAICMCFFFYHLFICLLDCFPMCYIFSCF